ncbi:MAG: Na+/H+ antiporter subunit E [Planctomycetota bacterium]
MKHSLGLGLVLFAVWVLWSGHLEPSLLILGLVSCGVVVALTRRMELAEPERLPGLWWRMVLYAPWLVAAIARANVDVARRILHPRLPIGPRVVRVRAGQRTDLGRVLYANSITLTPGTVSIDMEGDEITVHALTREAAEGLQSGAMDRRVTRMEGAG